MKITPLKLIYYNSFRLTFLPLSFVVSDVMHIPYDVWFKKYRPLTSRCLPQIKEPVFLHKQTSKLTPTLNLITYVTNYSVSTVNKAAFSPITSYNRQPNEITWLCFTSLSYFFYFESIHKAMRSNWVTLYHLFRYTHQKSQFGATTRTSSNPPLLATTLQLL